LGNTGFDLCETGHREISETAKIVRENRLEYALVHRWNFCHLSSPARFKGLSRLDALTFSGGAVRKHPNMLSMRFQHVGAGCGIGNGPQGKTFRFGAESKKRSISGIILERAWYY